MFYYMGLSLGIAGIIGSAIGAGSNLIGGILSDRNNRKLLDRQNQYNIDMWNMNNSYNDPSAQMERLKRAGLNPNLIYGNGHAATGISASAPEQTAFVSNALADSVRSSGQSVMQSIDNYLNYKQRLQNIDNSKLNNDILAEQKKRLAAETKIVEHDAEVITGKGGVSSKSKLSDYWNIARGFFNGWADYGSKKIPELIIQGARYFGNRNSSK